MTKGVFPPDIVAAARASQARWDIPASVCLAQWALESAWGGATPPGSNNPFGLKATGTQPAVAAPTHEVVGGASVPTVARFRRFDSLAEAFDAHGALLATSSHYAKARLLRHDPEAFAQALTGIYATDPQYGTKLVALMRSARLDVYDAASPSPASPPRAAPDAPAMSWWQRIVVALTFKKAA